MTTSIEAPLTALELKVMRSIATNDFGNGDVFAPIWADSINDSLVPSGIEGNALAGVVSSLAKKGFVICEHHGRDALVMITKRGAAALDAAQA